MRRALRNLDTGLFYAKGQWITEASLAEIFPDAESIAKVVIECRLQNAEMVFLSGEGRETSVLGGSRVPFPPGTPF